VVATARGVGALSPAQSDGVGVRGDLVANKPKALSAACGDWDIFDVLQSHILPGARHGPS